MSTAHVRHLFGSCTILVSVLVLSLVFYFFSVDQKANPLRVFAAGGTVPVLVSVVGQNEDSKQVVLEYGVESDLAGRLFAQEETRRLRGSEVFTQDIRLPATMVAGVYTAFVNIVDGQGATLEAAKLQFAVHAAGFPTERIKIYLLYLLFCAASVFTLYIGYHVVQKHKSTFSKQENV